MEENKINEILRKLSKLEQHVIDLIIPIQNIAQCLKSTTDIQNLIEALKRPIPINDSSLKTLLNEFRKDVYFLKNTVDEIKQDTKIEEIKYIGKRINEIDNTLKKIQGEGIRKSIQLDFTCDGYELVKKPIGYDSQEDPIEEPNEDLKALLDSLESREAKALIHRFGLLGEKEKTYEKVGEQLSVGRERARAICVKALRKCRNPSRKNLVSKITHSRLRKEILANLETIF